MTKRAIAAAVALGSLALAGTAFAEDFAPVDRAGPVLSVPRAELAASLRCRGNFAAPAGEPVVLLPGTLADPEETNVGYERALDRRGTPWCEVTIPRFTSIDIQTSAEYVVNAIRHASSLAGGRRVDILGISQGGGPLPRWPLRFWPDARNLVDDHVGLAPTNQGTVVADLICALQCVPALQQQRATARLYPALNSGRETFASIDSTAIYSRTDGLVMPADTQSPLKGSRDHVTNVAVQDLCPLNTTNHIGFLYDNVAYQLAIDALTHPGPANPARVAKASNPCARLTMPTLSEAEGLQRYSELTVTIFGARLMGEPQATTEPALRCYVRAACADRTRTLVSVSARKIRVKRTRSVVVTVRRLDNHGRSEPGDATVRLGGRRVRLGEDGTARVRVLTRKRGRRNLQVTPDGEAPRVIVLRAR